VLKQGFYDKKEAHDVRLFPLFNVLLGDHQPPRDRLAGLPDRHQVHARADPAACSGRACLTKCAPTKTKQMPDAADCLIASQRTTVKSTARGCRVRQPL